MAGWLLVALVGVALLGAGEAGTFLLDPSWWRYRQFGTTDGWGPETPRLMADVNGDGKKDVVGFDNAEGVYVSLSTGTGSTPKELWVEGYSRGWDVEKYPRLLADVNGDGKADVVGFGDPGVYISLSTGASFTPQKLWLANFGYSSAWRTNVHPRYVVDVNGDGKADVVGFAKNGVVVSLTREHKKPTMECPVSYKAPNEAYSTNGFYDSSNGEHPEQMFNGNATYWKLRSAPGGTDPEGVYAQFDARAAGFGYVVVQRFQAWFSCERPYRYKIQGSRNGKTWTDLKEVVGEQYLASWRVSPGFEVTHLGSTAADPFRFVRMLITKTVPVLNTELGATVQMVQDTSPFHHHPGLVFFGQCLDRNGAEVACQAPSGQYLVSGDHVVSLDASSPHNMLSFQKDKLWSGAVTWRMEQVGSDPNTVRIKTEYNGETRCLALKDDRGYQGDITYVCGGDESKWKKDPVSGGGFGLRSTSAPSYVGYLYVDGSSAVFTHDTAYVPHYAVWRFEEKGCTAL